MFYFSLILLVVLSLMLGFASGTEVMILLISSSLLSALLIIVLAVMDRRYVWYVPIYALLIITHFVYFFAGASFVPILIYGLAFVYFLCALFIYLAARSEVSPMCLITIAILMKICLVPELIINIMIGIASDNWDFLMFSLLLQLLSSGYAWMALWMMRRRRTIPKMQAVISSVMEIIPIMDMAVSMYVFLVALRGKGAYLARKNAKGKKKARENALYNKETFQAAPKHAKRAPAPFARKAPDQKAENSKTNDQSE